MLEIKPIQTKEEQKEVCGLCGVEFDPDFLAYGAKENGVLLGVSQFRILGKYAVIYDLANADGVDDLEALILTGKAALNFIDLCGVQDVIFNLIENSDKMPSALGGLSNFQQVEYIKTENGNLPKILGFIKDADGVYKLNLKGYFDSPCQKDK